MAESTAQAAARRVDRQNALADIQFASVIDSDLTPSEDESPEEKELQLETVQSAIGVSIGQQQTRLTSPKTPAAEKAAALEDTDGGLLFEGWQSQDGTMEHSATPPLVPTDGTSEKHGSPQAQVPLKDAESGFSKRDSPVRMPSPWRADPKAFQRAGEPDHRAILRDSFRTGSRRRAMSGGSASEALKKYLPFNLPTMPKTSSFLNFSLPSFSVSSYDNTRGRSPAAAQQKRIIPTNNPSSSSSIPRRDGVQLSRPNQQLRRSRSLTRPTHPSTEPIPQRQFAPITNARPKATDEATSSEDFLRRPIPRLRKSNSEGSLLLYRSRSWASSLGDDSRFEHVSEQVNSRMKAIKDSWQDSNFKFPSLSNLPNFSLGSREDSFKSRNASPTPHAVNSNASSSSINRRVSFLASSSSLRLPRSKDSSTNIAGMSSTAATTHPFFTKAVQELTGDLVVLGGYRGSILRSAEPPNRQMWVPIKVGLNLRKVDLELGLNPEDETTEETRVIPGGMLTHIGPVDIAKRLFKRLRASENAKNGSLRVHNYGYDWRLSPHILSQRLIEYLEKLPCNQPGVPPEKRGAIVLAHSLGGMITRHAINQRPELVAGVVYAGVPQGCVNILGPLRNGDDVLLSSRVLTAQVNFTIRTSYALLPLDGKCFINKRTKEEYPVDFFDINTWKEYRLSPCIAMPFPHPNAAPTSNLTSMSGILSAMSQALPNIPGRKPSISRGSSNNLGFDQTQSTTLSRLPNTASSNSTPVGAARDIAANTVSQATEGGGQTSGVTPQMSTTHKAAGGQEFATSQSNPATAVTIPPHKAIEYLTRTLADIKAFKLALSHRPEHSEANRYPPIALIYGKSTPTVYGAKVDSREAIKRADAYDELAFASGDGVVLARAAMVPEGYSVVRGGVVSSDRGHVTLLGDLEAVGRCLSAVIGARQNGIGLGKKEEVPVNK